MSECRTDFGKAAGLVFETGGHLMDELHQSASEFVVENREMRHSKTGT